MASTPSARTRQQAASVLDLLWQREARAHVGRRVQITVANAQDVAGRRVEATEDGVRLEQDGGRTVAVDLSPRPGHRAVGRPLNDPAAAPRARRRRRRLSGRRRAGTE